ncbi:MAG TPA: glycosyl hydrolase family 18 protein [Bryobacteraceae bacterium]|nr:glycosyl hydrolase family 18 protein [Bryobacteraceae bacterium]
MSTQQWFRSFIHLVSPLTARTTQVFTLALIFSLMAKAGVVVGYYQGSNAGSVPLKNLVTNGSAAELNYLIYAFEEPNANGSCTIQDLAAATQTAYTAANSVSGVADSGPLKGTFNQLKELKAKYPNLRVLVSIGGATLSGNFAGMAAGAASNSAAIDSCAKMFIDGNFTSSLQGYSGIFDGFDIDWEYPANSTQETNFTALLKAFRSELTTLGTQNGKTYTLTATMGPAKNASGTEFINVTAAAEYLDYVNVMSYDYMGSWSGGTGFDAPLYSSPLNGGSSYNITDSPWYTYNVSATFTANNGDSVGFIPQFKTAGIPITKLLLGIPFYGLEWDKVAADTYHGVFEQGTWVNTPSYAQIVQQYLGQPQYTQYCDYGNSASPYECSPNAGVGSQETWLYDGSSTFVSFDNETSVAEKVDFAKNQGLGGVMVWDLSQDSPGACLMGAIYTSMTGKKATNQDTALYNFESGVQGWTNTAGITVRDSEGEAFAGCKGLSVSFNNSTFAASADAYVLSPSGIKPGQTITMHIWIPVGSELTSVNPFITNTSWAWLASDYKTMSELTAGEWNTFSFTVPSNAPTTFGELGVEFTSSATWTGQVYIDSITN